MLLTSAWADEGDARSVRQDRVTELKVGESRELQLPEEEALRWGVASGSTLRLKETPEGLLIRPADPPLTRVYVEPTTRCNLSCRTCIRNS